MNFEKKDDIDIKDILDDKNNDVQVKKVNCFLYC